MYFVYILASQQNGTLYIGTTRNLQYRVWEHKQKKILGFPQKYNVTRLMYFEEFSLVMEAVARKKQLKK